MSSIYQFDLSNTRKETYNKTECLQILEVLLYLRDQKDTFGNRLLQFLSCCLRLVVKNPSSQKLEIPIPPRQWIVGMIELLGAVEGEDLSNMLHNSDAYRKIWQSVSGLSLLTPYSGKAWCWWDFFSFLTNVKVHTTATSDGNRRNGGDAMKPLKDSADRGAGSGCMARLVRIFDFIVADVPLVGWVMIVGLLVTAAWAWVTLL